MAESKAETKTSAKNPRFYGLIPIILFILGVVVVMVLLKYVMDFINPPK